jgi:3-deoxy-D-manno-octulosonic-acid transferase
MMWLAYEGLVLLGLLLYLPRALWRRRLPHRGWRMRLGRYPAALASRLHGRRSLWVHAVSVGEVLAARPLLRRLEAAAPEQPVVVSTVTSSGFAVAQEHLGRNGVAVYFPLDLRPCVRRALEALRPGLLLLMESELWPLVIHEAHARGIPVAVVNGRVSERAFRRWRLARGLLAGTLGRVRLFLMQREEDASRLRRLGAPADRVRVVGSLKWEASLSARPSAQAIGEAARRLGLDTRTPVLVGGSTHRGEEDALLGALARLRVGAPELRLILAPRHLERLGEVEALVRRAGLHPLRLSSPEPAPVWDVGLVDTFGQLSLYYGLATVVFIGGSLIPHGGQNPLEAASLGKPVLFGPSMHNFSDIARQLLDAGAARQLRSRRELAGALRPLLQRPGDAQALGRRAQELTERSQGAADRTLEALLPFLTAHLPSSS